MVSLHPSVLALGLLSLVSAAPVAETMEMKESATPTHAANASITAAPSGARPWYLDVVSENFVRKAAAIRSQGVSPEEASSVAKHLVDGALAPAPYTKLAAEGLQMWVEDGDRINPTSLYHYATDAEKAYETVHNDLAYWSLVAYAQSTAAKYFDLSRAVPTNLPEGVKSEASKAAKRQREYLTSAYSSLYADPSGSAGLSILADVATSYRRDFSPNTYGQATSSLMEKLAQELINLV